MKKAPIAFFTYKRPEHTLKSLESLALNEGAAESELFIFCDAPKRPEDENAVHQVREVVKSRQWCGAVYIIERENNMGCANSIINGVTEICEQYGRVIVVEDDLILSPFFLDYMNKALTLYANEERVMQISGYMFPIKLQVKTDAIFLPFTSSWGWASWQRAWQHFDLQMSGYEKLKKDRDLIYKFNINGSYPYFEMLESQIKGKIDSWAIRWYLSCFLLGGLTLSPTISLSKNIGFDGSGTHCGASDKEDYIYKEKIKRFPDTVLEDKKVTAKLGNYLNQNPALMATLSNYLYRVKNKLIKLLRV